MRLAVADQGYVGATEAFVSGNHLAARSCVSLADRLQASAGMAGDDSTATAFASSYDDAAASSVAAVGDLVGALASLGHLAEASLANHDHADAASVLPGWAADVAGPRTLADRAVGVVPAAPPSSLGAAEQSPSGPAGWVLDHLQDVVWPNADTDRVRVAASAWRVAAQSVSLVSAHCDAALLGLQDEVSPEIPLALATTRDLRSRVDTLADQLVAIADACDTYADQVDEKRSAMLDLLHDLVVELGVGALIAGGLSLLSGGLAGVAAGGATSARLATAARDLKLIVDGLRMLTGGTALEMRPIAATAGESGGFFSRLAGSRAMVMSEEAGGAAGRGSWRDLGDFRRGWLTRHEHSGSHTLAEHVGQSDSDLLDRLARRRGIPFASSFSDQDAAERLIGQAIKRKGSVVEEWLKGGEPRKRLETVLKDTGRSASRDGTVSDVSAIRVVLERDPSMPQGFRILTAFPQPSGVPR